MATYHSDILITGAGPAGSTAALALKHSGLKVHVIDKSTFPRDKICGDAVSSVTQRVLRQIDPELEKELLAFAPKAYIQSAILYSTQFKPLKVTFSKTGYCIRRYDFDHWLYQKATSNPDATFFHGHAIRSVNKTTDGIEAEDEAGNHFHARLLIACDGANSVAARQLGNFTIDRMHHSGAVRQYYHNVAGLDGTSLEVYFLKDYLPGYFWIFPLSGNDANVGYGMLSDTISRHKIDLKTTLHDIIHNIPEIAKRFENATPLEITKGFGLPLGSRKRVISGSHFMLCGDAASLIDPFSGEGIETAMESGKFAAETAMKCFETSDFSAEALHAYDERVYRKMWPGFRNHYYFQKILGKRPGLLNTLVSVGNIPWVNRQITNLFY